MLKEYNIKDLKYFRWIWEIEIRKIFFYDYNNSSKRLVKEVVILSNKWDIFVRREEESILIFKIVFLELVIESRYMGFVRG